MAGGGKRGGGDRVLESRHLVGLFLGVVLLCGVFFTLGYVMGHNQYGGAVHASDLIKETEAAIRPAAKHAEPDLTPAPAPSPANNEWDFYSKKDNDRLEPAAPPAAASSAPATAAKSATAPSAAAHTVPAAARFQPPSLTKGSIVLQVAALRHESDALAMADVLQQKHFPSFVVTPTTDSFYRVQVGPYPDQRAADSARAALDHAGFKAIIKR
ncbi:MAG TPA: SPOR domain-containing protein [Candidatus Acidoferrales bacterium]|nr:SPOR domain-containing protein [Candidatus Acidoferrales bacterium]